MNCYANQQVPNSMEKAWLDGEKLALLGDFFSIGSLLLLAA
jgi:hypothetical protein